MSEARRFPWVERGVFLLAIVLLSAWSYVKLDSREYQSEAARRIQMVGLDRLRTEPVHRDADAVPRTRQLMMRSGIIGNLEIPIARISSVVAEGTDALTLDRAIGHLVGTDLPGEGGHVALAGHRDTFFRRLGRVRLGDRIRFTTPDGTYEYRVSKMGVVPPDRTDVIRESALTLITCYPFDAIGHAPLRFVVQAEPVARSSESQRTAYSIR